jgi:hypothetical protein
MGVLGASVTVVGNPHPLDRQMTDHGERGMGALVRRCAVEVADHCANLRLAPGTCSNFIIASRPYSGAGLHGVASGRGDDSSAQQLYARQVYSWRDIRWQHRYKRHHECSAAGRFLLDYTKFHHAVPED